MIKAIIIDDEPKGRNILQQLLIMHFKEVQVVALAENADEGLRQIDIHKPDVIFLDVEMPGKSGFDLLREAGTIDFKIVFVTAYNHYSLKAIKFNAFDYLLKPVDLDELKLTVDKLRKLQLPADEKLMDNLLKSTHPSAKGLSKIAISSLDSITLIDTAEIIFFEALGGATAVHLAAGNKIIASRTLKEYEDLLTENFFFRIHHSYLINLRHILKYIKGEGGSVLMNNNKELEVSRRKKAAFMEMLANYTMGNK